MEIVCSRYCALMSKRGEEWRSAYCHFQITFWQLDMQSFALLWRHQRVSLSAIIPTQTVSYCDSSSKWTISKMLYCYFNPLRLIFPFAWHFFPLGLLPLCKSTFQAPASFPFFTGTANSEHWYLKVRGGCNVRVVHACLSEPTVYSYSNVVPNDVRQELHLVKKIKKIITWHQRLPKLSADRTHREQSAPSFCLHCVCVWRCETGTAAGSAGQHMARFQTWWCCRIIKF